MRVAGLYVITPDEPSTDRLARMVDEATAGGAAVVQYRNKSASAWHAKEQAKMLRRITRARGVPLIVNDSVDLALTVSADGVHLGESDGDIEAARARLGRERLLGASCYDDLERGTNAIAAGADYIAFGSIFSSPTKPAARRASLELLQQARRRFAVPIVAIGGITAESAASVYAAGADAVAVISAVFDVPDIREAAARFATMHARHGDGSV